MAGDDQQREILLGNKQLLSIFFIVVAMMGVAFTMGYIIGRNGGNVNAASLGSSPAGTSRNQPAAPPASTSDDQPPPQTVTPTPTPIPSREKPVRETHAATPHEDSTPLPAAKPPAKTPAPSEPVDDQKPVAGATYLQVAALKRQDAEHIVHVLKEREFPAILGESPKEGYFRVLVGPFANMRALADSKAKLRAAGFDSIVAR